MIEATIKIVASASALYFVFRQIEFKQIKEVFLDAQFIYLLPALLLFIISKVISAIRLNIFFRQTGVKITERSNLKLYWAGMFYNMFLPGGISGDGYKVYLLARSHNTSVKNLVWMVFIDRLTGVMILGVLALFFFGLLDFANEWRYLIWGSLIVGSFLLLWIVKRFQPYIWEISFRVILLSFGVQIMQILSVIFILISFGFNEYLLGYITIFLISSIVSVIPITIGGAGARELTFLYGSDFLNLQTDISITLSLTFYLITLATSLAGMIFILQPDSYLVKNEIV